MSLESLCSQDEISVITQTAATGGDSIGTEYNDSAPVTKKCLVQELSASEALNYQARGMQVSHQVFFAADPGITLSSKLVWHGDTLAVVGTYTEGRPGCTTLWCVNANLVTTRDR